jgi:hypothetical protein
MDHAKTPLPEEMDRIDGDDNQQLDTANPMLHTINNDDVIDNSAGFDNSEAGTDATQGLTPMHRQNVDESSVENLLVQDNLDDSDYPTIVDIADRDAAEHSDIDSL